MYRSNVSKYKLKILSQTSKKMPNLVTRNTKQQMRQLQTQAREKAWRESHPEKLKEYNAKKKDNVEYHNKELIRLRKRHAFQCEIKRLLNLRNLIDV